MSAVADIFELGNRMAWAVLRLLAGLLGLAISAVAGLAVRTVGRSRRQLELPDDSPDEADLQGFRMASSAMQQMHRDRDKWPEPPPISTPLRPMTYPAYRNGRR
jgi:hypothetical protein